MIRDQLGWEEVVTLRMTATTDFDEFFNARRRVAAEAYTNGDSQPLDSLVTRNGAATFHSPRGDTVSGADAVATRYRSDAASFAPGGETALQVLQQGASGDLAFWTGFQDATVHLAGRDQPVTMRIRVTEVFRREAAQWKLIHRHADVPPS
jgi:ketosteroid isomerase-like protein